MLKYYVTFQKNAVDVSLSYSSGWSTLLDRCKSKKSLKSLLKSLLWTPKAVLDSTSIVLTLSRYARMRRGERQ